MRVLAAMSGGVDSAVAAARAVDAGHDVTGVHLALARNPQTFRTGARGCCTLEDSRDARRAADVIGIPFYVWDMAEQFHDDVVDDFVAEYAAGRTPNPCLRCNEKIKFTAVLDRAVALGFDAVVTGHHARLGADGLLRRSVDIGKDQSYVLAVLTRAQLDRAIFPLGDTTKLQVRAEAAERGLAVAEKPDSHDICFISDGDTKGFLASRLGSAPGDVVDARTGAKVGTHDGAYAYTIGQRKGLDLRVPAPDGKPRYVLSITPKTNTVTVGSHSDLEVDTVTAIRPIWHGDAGPIECEVQMRAHGEVVPGVVTVDGGDLTARLRVPARGIAAGQAIVAYRPDPDGDIVLGSATISAGFRSSSPASASTSSCPSASASTSSSPSASASTSSSASASSSSASSAAARSAASASSLAASASSLAASASSTAVSASAAAPPSSAVAPSSAVSSSELRGSGARA